MTIFYCLYLASFLKLEDDYGKREVIFTQEDVYDKFLGSNIVSVLKFWFFYLFLFISLIILKYSLFEGIKLFWIILTIMFCVFVNWKLAVYCVKSLLPHTKFDIDYSEFIKFSDKYDKGEFFLLSCIFILHYFIYWFLFSWGLFNLIWLQDSVPAYWFAPVLVVLISLTILNFIVKISVRAANKRVKMDSKS